MKSSINLSKSINSSVSGQFLEILNKILNKIDKGILQSNKDPERPKVTKISLPPKEHDSLPPVANTDPERPKVTKIKAKKKRTPGQEDTYDYTFDFDINMNGNSGNLTIEMIYEAYVVICDFDNVPENQTNLTCNKNNQSNLFGGLSTGNYNFTVSPYMNTGEPVSPKPSDSTTMVFTVISELTLGQKIGNFFRRLFGR
jgi:hypothetical protein